MDELQQYVIFIFLVDFMFLVIKMYKCMYLIIKFLCIILEEVENYLKVSYLILIGFFFNYNYLGFEVYVCCFFFYSYLIGKGCFFFVF